jgi:general secretion pathway protein C
MKRLPLVATFLLFIALCASAAYWGMQLFKPPLRPVAAPPRAAQADINPDAAAVLFGARAGKAAVASNYQLKGVIFSGNPRDSVAIIGADGKPAQAIRAELDIAPGVTLKEVHREYVLLSEGGATKRVELPEEVKGQISAAITPARAAPPPAPGQVIPPRGARQAAPAQAPQAPVISTGPPTSPQAPPAPAQSAAVPAPAQTPAPAQGQTQAQQPVPPQQGQAPRQATAPPTVVVSPPPGTSATVSPPIGTQGTPLGTQVAPMGTQPQTPTR